MYELLLLAWQSHDITPTPAKKLKFWQLVDCCKKTSIAGFNDDLPIIDDGLAEAISEFNKIRNKFAHQFKFALSYEDAHELVCKLGAAGIEFTDNVCESRQAAQSLGYSVDDLIDAATQSLFFELGMVLQQAGGPDLIS